MATYRETQAYVKEKYGFLPKSCWIAHVKEINELNPRFSSRRYYPKARHVPCPRNKVEPIQQTLKHFGMI